MKKIMFPKYAREIMVMVERDQCVRAKNRKDGKPWNALIDHNNTRRLQEIVSAILWPTRSKVGKKASAGAWLLAQHADHHPVFQLECLLHMKQWDPPEVELKHIAHLHDRVLLNIGGPQLYGTQFRQVNGEHVPRPIYDQEHVDQRRKSMGLDTLKQGIARMYKKYPMKRSSASKGAHA